MKVLKKLLLPVLLRAHPSYDESQLEDVTLSLAVRSLQSCYMTSLTQDKYTVGAI
jgi:hypothetical protein